MIVERGPDAEPVDARGQSRRSVEGLRAVRSMNVARLRMRRIDRPAQLQRGIEGYTSRMLGIGGAVPAQMKIIRD